MKLETTKPRIDKKTDKKRAAASTRKVPFFARNLDGKLVVKTGVTAGREQAQK